MSSRSSEAFANTYIRIYFTMCLRCVSYIGCQCQSRDEWSSRLHVLYTSRWPQQHRRTLLTTFDSSLSMVDVISDLAYFQKDTSCFTDTSTSLVLNTYGFMFDFIFLYFFVVCCCFVHSVRLCCILLLHIALS